VQRKTWSQLDVNPEGTSTSHIWNTKQTCPLSFCNVVTEVCFLDHAQFWQQNWLQTILLTNQIYIQEEVFPFCSYKKNLLNILPFHQECTCFMWHCLSKRHNDGPKFPWVHDWWPFFDIRYLYIKFHFRHTMNDSPSSTTHFYAFKCDHLESHCIHMYSLRFRTKVTFGHNLRYETKGTFGEISLKLR
jgi:hypothetical protein